MSVGHISRVAEESGIATVIVAAAPFEKRLTSMSLPRLVLTSQLMGRPMGIPNDVEFQTRTLEKAMELLESAQDNGTVARIN